MPEPSSSPSPAIVERLFTRPQTDPYDLIDWEVRTAQIGRPGEVPVFEQTGVEVPASWSQNATNIVAQKYFAYAQSDPRRERSVRQLIDRIVSPITAAGRQHHYFTNEDAKVFSAELKHILVHQYAAFNSPVWFNVGRDDVEPQCSACFILSVDDTMESILNWYTEEGKIFKRGSGAGINLSMLRGAKEGLSKGGFSSGPVTFMRAADANAGTIASGGATRRAAKMVILDINHPDIEDFILAKAREEDRIRALKVAGFDMDLGSEVGELNLAEATAYQNANNSVRVSQAFLDAVEADEEWELIARTDGSVTKTVRARELMERLAEAAWKCADPGIQFDTTINEWHTTPAEGRINGSNPCSEYMHIDDSACNLASLNLMKFLRTDGSFDVDSFRHVTRIMFLAQEITVAFSSFPTEKIAENTKDLRQIGIGYANLGALLMALGLPYDSDEGRNIAAAITALLTGESYSESARIATRVGPFARYEANRQSMLKVLRKHRQAARALRGGQPELVKAARQSWDEAIKLGEASGYRNAQASVLAPTGTIAFLMDCDTTGIEPDFTLIKGKTLAGGGMMSIPNRTLPMALERLGYNNDAVREILAWVMEDIDKGGGFSGPRGSVIGAPHLDPAHYSVFACAIGDNAIRPMGHVLMMAAVQPFLSGAISKTCNLPSSATVEEVMEVYLEAGRLGLKALAVYRDGCKVFQPLGDVRSQKPDPSAEKALEERVTSVLGDGLLRGEKRRVPREAQVIGVNFEVGTTSGYIHVRLFEDGRPGAIFIDVGQAGHTLRGFINALAIAMSVSLQHGTPLDAMVEKLAFMQFEPYGMTDDPAIRQARSIVDYVVRWLALAFLDPSIHPALGINAEQAAQRSLAPTPSSLEPEGIAPTIAVHAPTRPAVERNSVPLKLTSGSAPLCQQCGSMMNRTGTCFTCPTCASSGGCG